MAADYASRSAAGYLSKGKLYDTVEPGDVIYSYTNRNTDVVEKFFVYCDMTEKFPFLITKMSPYYDR